MSPDCSLPTARHMLPWTGQKKCEGLYYDYAKVRLSCQQCSQPLNLACLFTALTVWTCLHTTHTRSSAKSSWMQLRMQKDLRELTRIHNWHWNITSITLLYALYIACLSSVQKVFKRPDWKRAVCWNLAISINCHQIICKGLILAWINFVNTKCTKLKYSAVVNVCDCKLLFT